MATSRLLFTVVVIGTWLLYSSEGLLDSVHRPCIEEEYDVDKFYLYKANAAPIVIRGQAVQMDSKKSPNDLHQPFYIANATLYKGKEYFDQLELRNLFVLFGESMYYVNPGKSECGSMDTFKKLRFGKEFMFYLSKTSQPDQFAINNLPMLSAPTLTLFAQPDVHKSKLLRVMKEELFCENCKCKYSTLCMSVLY